ncbi:hypothetical protein C2845_PM05G20100 [Panicum miliaceum]|uniref:Uncharacterized protein n=1 Tax=Panicum miliaceum TaxID=4540 RepID=A0A3L6T544_PANMI|nr:hypothetical protein C2845_PM05G20100 [Panicum miliaceum]
MASIREVNDDEPGIEFDTELENDISCDENTADAPQDEDEEQKRRHHLRNSKRNKRRRNAQERTRNPHWWRNLHGEFEAAADEEFVTPMGNIYEASLLLQQIPQMDATQRIMRLVKQATIQLDKMDPLKSVQHTHSRSERHGSSVPQGSRTPSGHINPRNNRQAEQERKNDKGNNNNRSDKGQYNNSGAAQKRKPEDQVANVERNPRNKKSCKLKD